MLRFSSKIYSTALKTIRKTSTSSEYCKLDWLTQTKPWTPALMRQVDTDPDKRKEVERFMDGGVYKDQQGFLYSMVNDRNLEPTFHAVCHAFATDEPLMTYAKVSTQELIDIFGIDYVFKHTNYRKFSVSVSTEDKVVGGLIVYGQETAPKEDQLEATTESAKNRWQWLTEGVLPLLEESHKIDVNAHKGVLHVIMMGLVDEGTVRGSKAWWVMKTIQQAVGYLKGYRYQFGECTSFKSARAASYFASEMFPLLKYDTFVSPISGKRPFPGLGQGITFYWTDFSK